MGAKQSKRSVDISGKEAEGGGEVAVAGAAGEGRVEQLADADALKPQLNGAAHIQLEQTDKEKELDVGTPENEKDATTEKEGKEADDADTEAAPVTNGETEPKVENGESTPTPEDGKKPKKEKVKKKWSLRSISFSRKDKPKQEKKQKDEEPKTNGEPEKVPEETAEAVPEATVNEVAEEAKTLIEEKDEKTPETPVTEPLTNGTSTPESTKAETPASDEVALAPAPSSPAEKPEVAPEPQPEPEQLPVNGLSLEEPKLEIPAIEKLEETIPEPPAAETAEIVPAPDIPKEVCVEQLPLLEPTPPPLPANPPPSSVASFAATTMAPELTDASLANTADSAIAPISALPETKDILVKSEFPSETVSTKIPENEIPFILKENNEDAPAVTDCKPEVVNNVLEETLATVTNISKQLDESPKLDKENITKEPSETITSTIVIEATETITNPVATETIEIESQTTVSETPKTIVDNETQTLENVSDTVIPEPRQIEIPERNEPLETETTKVELTKVDIEKIEAPETSELNFTETESVSTQEVQDKANTAVQANVVSVVTDTVPEPENIPECVEVDVSEADDSSLPPPPMQDDDDCAPPLDDEKVEESLKQIPDPITETEQTNVESNHVSSTETSATNGVHDISPDAADDTELLKKKAKAALANAADAIECNGGGEEQAAESPCLPNGAAAPPSSAAQHTPQEPLPVSDKLADLIPEVPEVPELKPETLQETVTDVAVAN